MMNNMNTVTIDRKVYGELLDESLLLNCLRNAGVDNWEWWDVAISEYHRIKEEEESQDE